MIAGHRDVSLPPGAIPLGKNIEEVKACALAATFVIQRAASHCAHQLAARFELNKRDRLAAYDSFVDTLLEEAVRAPLDGFHESDENGGKSALCAIIRRVTRPPRTRLGTE